MTALNELPCLIELSTINRGVIGTRYVTYRTPSLHLHIGCIYQEQISLLVMDTPKHPLIFGNPWLYKHDAVLSWSSRKLIKWSDYCWHNCLLKPVMFIASIESPDSSLVVQIPSEYTENQSQRISTSSPIQLCN